MPESTSPQALQDTPTTPWAGFPIPPGRCARFYLPTRATWDSDHPLGRTLHPSRPVCPNLPPHRPCKTLRPPLGRDSPFRQAGVPESTSPQTLQDIPTTPWAELPVPPGWCARFYVPTGPSGHSDHPLGGTPRPPRPVCPVLPPHKRFRTLRPPPGQDSPSPQAGVPRIYLPTGPAGHSDHPLGRTPRSARPVCPNLPPHRPCKTFPPPPGQNPPSPQAGVPGSTSPQALQDTPTTPWAELCVPPGRCARFYLPTSALGHSDHALGRTPRPPRPVCHESTSPQALHDTPTTPWAGLPIPLGRCARFYIPTGPSGHSDHPLGRTPRPSRPVCPVLPPRSPCRTLRPPPVRTPRPPRPVCPVLPPHRPLRTLRPPPGQDSRPPRPVCPVLHPHRPFKTLRPPPGQDSPSPQAGVPESTSPQALRDTLTTPWAGLPVPPGRFARIYIPTGPAGHSDHPLGRPPRPPRLLCPVLHPHSPFRTLRPPPGRNSPSP